ncbi:hypothetical protein ACIOZM_13775 [Pseudomonas sp. NPDC087346]|uniref:hypothetical protein n=1 Tax=Pseudomonas sp. NPDC087346 TaxID=3364438 RepID=UPI0038013198
MYKKFDELIGRFATDEFPIDYWSDVAIVEASDMLDNFSDDDWSTLLSSVRDKSEYWVLRMCESMGVAAEERALYVILEVMSREREEVTCAALDAIRSMVSLGLDVSKYSGPINATIESAKMTKSNVELLSVLNLEKMLLKR